MNRLVRWVTFKANDLSLEGILYDLDTTRPAPGIAVCHPHPLMGGDMSNNVIVSVCEHLNDRGITALSFNFRGVGNSEGTYGGGKGEVEDARGAVSFLASWPNVDPARIGIVGYSFGANVAISAAAADETIAAVAAISPQAALLDRAFISGYTRPKMLICGAEDDIVDVKGFEAVARKLAEPKVWEIVPNADHFWADQDDWLGARVVSFFAETFGGES